MTNDTDSPLPRVEKLKSIYSIPSNVPDVISLDKGQRMVDI